MHACLRACTIHTCMHTHAYMDARRVLSRGGNRALRTQAQAPPEPKGVEAQDEARRAHRPAPGGLLRPAQLQVARARVPVRRCPAAGIVVRAPSSLPPFLWASWRLHAVGAGYCAWASSDAASVHVVRRTLRCMAPCCLRRPSSFAVTIASQPCSPVGLEAAPRKAEEQTAATPCSPIEYESSNMPSQLFTAASRWLPWRQEVRRRPSRCGSVTTWLVCGGLRERGLLTKRCCCWK